MQFKTIIEPFRIKSVEPISLSTEEQRIQYLKEAHYNPFLLKSEQVIIDFLTDSGTSAMSSNQWAAMMNGDESYAGARSWERFQKAVFSLTSMPHILPTHQGRAAERILYSHLGGKGRYFISNTHFDTTRANIEYSGAEAIDIPCEEAHDYTSNFPFKGNMDVEKLEKLILEKGPDNVSAVILTVTNNSGGGQPVNMQNAKDVAKICKKYGVLYVLDCCRVAENAYFIKHNEKEYADKTYKEIAQEMFAMCDAAVMSAKKDALVNIGGFLALNDKSLYDEASNMVVIYEGLHTYGGLAGRDMEAMAIGITESVDDNHIRARVGQVEYLGNKLVEAGIPIVLPIGGHGIFLDAKKFLPHLKQIQFPAQALAAEIYLDSGVRTMERGIVSAGRNKETGENYFPELELVRLTIPRRVYTQAHMDVIAESVISVYKNRKKIKGLEMTYEPKYLRFFQAKFKKS